MTVTLAKPGDTLTQRLTLSVISLAEEPADPAESSEEQPWELVFTALGIPYDEELRRTDWTTGASRQTWSQGSVTVAENNQVHFQHDWQALGLPIGRILSAEQTDEGLLITGGISRTTKGIEVATLMRDGVLTRISAGLTTTSWHLDDDGDLLVHDESEAFEFSVCTQPAYDTAAVRSVNSNTHTEQENHRMTVTLDGLSADLNSLSEAVTGLERRIETLPNTLGQPSGPAPVPFTRYGDFIKALARGDEEAMKFAQFVRLSLREQDADAVGLLNTLAYTGGTTADLGAWMKDSWIGDTFRLATVNRKLHNFFASAPLPAEGNNVEFGTLAADTTQVAEQVNEGDTLAYGKIEFDTDTAKVHTYGGWGEMSLQQIQRSPINVVEKFFTALIRRYAQVTEATLKAVTLTTTPHTLAGAAMDLQTPAGWNSFLIRASIYLEDTYGLAPEAVILGYDVYEDLANMTVPAGTDYVFDREAGTLDLAALGGQVHRIRLLPISTGATENFVRVAHSEAIRTLESGNAPTQLMDNDITNLTQAFSVYGYEAIAPEEPGLLIAPATGAAA